MSLKYIRVQSQRPLLEQLVSWYNHEQTRHLYVMYPSERAYVRGTTLAQVERRLVAKDPKLFRIYVVFEGDVPVGHMSIELDCHLLRRRRPKSAWISVAIADKAAQGRGLGKQMMRILERVARDMGAKRIELGVFSFNRRAQGFYDALGYEEFGVFHAATWWRGKKHDAILMERIIGR